MASAAYFGSRPTLPPTSGTMPQSMNASIPPRTSPGSYGAASFPYAYPTLEKPRVPGASRDLLDGGYVNEGEGEIEPFYKSSGIKIGDYSNSCSLCAVFFLPVVYFVVVYWLLAFQPRFYMPIIAWILVILLAGAIVLAGAAAFFMAMQDKISPTIWAAALCIGLFVAFVTAIPGACHDYTNFTEPMYARRGLHAYSGVDPSKMDGTAFMDAGSLSFTNAHLDQSKSGGFMNQDMYCVAPIVSSDKTTNYDFWAVGLNCCTGGNDFHCGGGGGMEGLRLMSNSQQEFYKLAVSQTAAANNIKAEHPIFFHWSPDKWQSGDAIASGNMARQALHIFMFSLVLTFFAAIATQWFNSRVK